jgi:hypothetical protein
MLRLILILSMLTACGRHKSQNTDSGEPDVTPTLNTYLSLSSTVGDSYGFLGDTCDSLLWTDLYDTAGGKVDLTQAEISPGQWKRNPSTQCTSISRDMILGLLTYIWHSRDLNMIEQLIDYGEANSFKMSVQSETDGAEIMTPDIIATMYEIRYRLGGPDSTARLFAQSLWVGGQTGYLAHLQVLHIFLRALMIGSVTNNELSLLQQHSQQNPDNALFAAVYHKYLDGDQTQAINSLLNVALFPSGSLPTNENYCSDPYLFQRDEYSSGTTLSQDWTSCTQVVTHPGIDYEFAAGVILGTVQ